MANEFDVNQAKNPPPLAVLRQCLLGWVIDLQDTNGIHLLSSAAYPSKFLAEEALGKILARAGHCR